MPWTNFAFAASLSAAAWFTVACSNAQPLRPPILADQPAARNVPGGCSEPAAGRQDQVGCYLTDAHFLGRLPDGPLFWHVYTYPDVPSAQAAGGERSNVVEAFDRVWLYSIEREDWRPRRGGERLAVIGPLRTQEGTGYTARYMQAVFAPGMRTGVHAHSGPEAWYVISGAQCLQTPDGNIVARAGEGAVVPEGPPMVLSSLGNETRRSVFLVLHDATKPWTMVGSTWQPDAACE